MKQIGIRELRQHASRYVAMVKSGQTVAVTSRGELVAVMQPPGKARSERDRLIAEGLLLPASQPTGRLRSPQPVPSRPGDPTNAELLDDQREVRV
jgi:prevent-host-death family protein